MGYRRPHHDALTRSLPVIGALDVGTSKICCVIATATNPPRLLALSHQRSRGVKAGVITDLDEAEQSIRATVARAESQAGVTLDAVHLSITGGRMASAHFSVATEVTAGAVNAGDVDRLVNGARRYCAHDGRSLVHLNPVAYRLDGSPPVAAPLGMAGSELAADFHAVTVDDGPLNNLRLLIERCYLEPARTTPAGLASARVVASAEELRGGVTVVDMGAGTTSVAVVADGHDLFVDTLPIGGNHVTFDLMAALGCSFAEAERIKVLYGTMVEASSDQREIVSYPRLSEAEPELYETTRAEVRRLIAPRVDSLLTQAMERLAASGIEAYGGGRLVLTGGASQLVGLPMYIGRKLGRSVRLGAPAPLAGMSQSSCNPVLSTAIGLVAAAANGTTVALRPQGYLPDESGYLGRVGQWLRESF